MDLLNRQIDGRRWAWNQRCDSCGWQRLANMPWTVRDALKPPRKCPECGNRLSNAVLDCPACGKQLSKLRFPRSIRMALWGGHYCKICGIVLDKWGDQVRSTLSTRWLETATFGCCSYDMSPGGMDSPRNTGASGRNARPQNTEARMSA